MHILKETAANVKVFIAPHYARFRWILCLIDLYNNIVYYLDSLRNQEERGTRAGIIGDLLEIINTVLPIKMALIVDIM